MGVEGEDIYNKGKNSAISMRAAWMRVQAALSRAERMAARVEAAEDEGEASVSGDSGACQQLIKRAVRVSRARPLR